MVVNHNRTSHKKHTGKPNTLFYKNIGQTVICTLEDHSNPCFKTCSWSLIRNATREVANWPVSSTDDNPVHCLAFIMCSCGRTVQILVSCGAHQMSVCPSYGWRAILISSWTTCVISKKRKTHEATPKKFPVSSLLTDPFSREIEIFLPNIPLWSS